MRAWEVGGAGGAEAESQESEQARSGAVAGLRESTRASGMEEVDPREQPEWLHCNGGGRVADGLLDGLGPGAGGLPGFRFSRAGASAFAGRQQLAQLADLDEQELAAILSQDLAGLDAELAGALIDPPPETKLMPVAVKQPPKMAWVLVGIPLVRFSEINAEVEKMSAIEGTIVETTVNDQESLDGKQPRKRKA